MAARRVRKITSHVPARPLEKKPSYLPGQAQACADLYSEQEGEKDSDWQCPCTNNTYEWIKNQSLQEYGKSESSAIELVYSSI